MSATTTGARSIDRAARLLVHVVETDVPPTVGELSDRTGLPKSTTSRLVGALERQGLIQRDGASGQLRPGSVLVRFARRETGDAELVEVAAEALDRLASESGETVNLGVPSAGAVEQLAQRDSRHYLGSTNWVGRRVPPHGSALGKVFLAHGVIALPDGTLEPLAPSTLDRGALLRDLDQVRARGFATAVDELEPGLWAVAAPVYDADGSVVGALSIAGPTLRLREGLLDELGALTRREASRVSVLLGYDERRKGAA